MPASDNFEKLGAQLNEAVARVQAAASQAKAQLTSRVDAAR
jgi:hypothetical protein